MARILVVDANEENVAIITAYLRWHGYTVSGSTDPHRAVGLGAKQSWDLMIIDAHMLIHDGVGVLAMLRITSPSAPIKVIALTSITAESVSEQRIDSYVSKPVDLAVLLAEVRRHLV